MSVHIVVRMLTGKTINLDVDVDILIADVKRKIQDEEHIPPHQQRLIFDGKQLINDKFLSDYDVKDYSVLYLVLRAADSVRQL